MNSKRLLVTLTLVAGLLVALNCMVTPPERADIRIVTPPSIIASLPHWVAEDRQFYGDAGLNVITVDITSSNLMVQALIDGDADVLPAVSLVDVLNSSADRPIKPLIYSHSRMRNDPRSRH